MTEIVEKKDHKFKPGQSGNPRGRPKGSRNKHTLLKQAIVEKSEKIIIKHFPKIVEAVCEKAKEGDISAAKLLIERFIPVKKAEGDNSREKMAGGIRIVVENIVPADRVPNIQVDEYKEIEGIVISETEDDTKERE